MAYEKKDAQSKLESSDVISEIEHQPNKRIIAFFLSELKRSLIPLLLAPISIWMGFSLNSWLARPNLSIEDIAVVVTSRAGVSWPINELKSDATISELLPDFFNITYLGATENGMMAYEDYLGFLQRIEEAEYQIEHLLDFLATTPILEIIENPEEALQAGVPLGVLDYLQSNTPMAENYYREIIRVSENSLVRVRNAKTDLFSLSGCRIVARALIRNRGQSSGIISSVAVVSIAGIGDIPAQLTEKLAFGANEGGIAVRIVNDQAVFDSGAPNIRPIGNVAPNAINEAWFISEPIKNLHACESGAAADFQIIDGEQNAI